MEALLFFTVCEVCLGTRNDNGFDVLFREQKLELIVREECRMEFDNEGNVAYLNCIPQLRFHQVSSTM